MTGMVCILHTRSSTLRARRVSFFREKTTCANCMFVQHQPNPSPPACPCQMLLDDGANSNNSSDRLEYTMRWCACFHERTISFSTILFLIKSHKLTLTHTHISVYSRIRCHFFGGIYDSRRYASFSIEFLMCSYKSYVYGVNL